MVRSTALLALIVVPVAAGAKTKPWVPHPIHVVPGVPLKPEDIKPYVPPKLAPEPELEPSDVKVIEVTAPEAVIEIRPWSSPMVGNALHGARLPVRGVVKTTRGGCSSKVWYAIDPFGYLCGREGKPTAEPPSTEQVLKVRESSRLPFQYVMALVAEGVKIPMWATVDDLKKGNEPERQLEKGDTVAVEKEWKYEDTKYWISVDGKVIPQKGFSLMGGGSHWHGIDITEADLPFGWITAEKANVYAAAPQKGEKPKPATTLARRTRVKIVDEVQQGKRAKWLKVTVLEPPPEETVGDIIANVSAKKAPPKKETSEAAAPPPPAEPLPAEMWVSADAVNEVRHLDRPKTIPDGVTKWIDVDLGEQVLVLYQDDKPIYATLVSSGRAIATPMGTYPVWAKVSAITMKNQPYEDKEYFVNKVPWSTFFQWHNAIHGAYWHDRFGVTKSHGCVNVAPLDAKHVFEWVEPPLPAGWTGLRPLELLKSPTVVTRNSHMAKQFRQDRPIGPPDRQLEAERVVEADQRRAEEAQAAAAAAPPAGTDPAVVPAAIQAPAPPKP